MSQETKNTKTLTPRFRFRLKAKIIESGCETLTEFSKKTGIDVARISKIVRGWEIPGHHIQRIMAECLGITLTELKDLLK